MPSTPGETNVPVSDWTTGTLKILQDQNVANIKELLETEICAIRKTMKESDRRYEQRFDAQEKATGVAITSAKEAVTKAEASTERRFESVNEFRAALSDQSASLMSRAEVEQLNKSLSDKIDEQGKLITELRSRLDVGNPVIGTIQQQLAATAGMQQGEQMQMGKIYAFVGGVGAILGIIIIIANAVFK